MKTEKEIKRIIAFLLREEKKESRIALRGAISFGWLILYGCEGAATRVKARKWCS